MFRKLPFWIMLKLQIEATNFLVSVALTIFTFSRKVKLRVFSSLTKKLSFGIECTPLLKGGEGAEKNMVLGVRFQNLRKGGS